MLVSVPPASTSTCSRLRPKLMCNLIINIINVKRYTKTSENIW